MVQSYDDDEYGVEIIRAAPVAKPPAPVAKPPAPVAKPPAPVA